MTHKQKIEEILAKHESREVKRGFTSYVETRMKLDLSELDFDQLVLYARDGAAHRDATTT